MKQIRKGLENDIMLMDWQTQFGMMPVFPRLFCRFSTIPINISTALCVCVCVYLYMCEDSDQLKKEV